MRGLVVDRCHGPTDAEPKMTFWILQRFGVRAGNLLSGTANRGSKRLAQ